MHQKYTAWGKQERALPGLLLFSSETGPASWHVLQRTSPEHWSTSSREELQRAHKICRRDAQRVSLEKHFHNLKEEISTVHSLFLLQRIQGNSTYAQDNIAWASAVSDAVYFISYKSFTPAAYLLNLDAFQFCSSKRMFHYCRLSGLLHFKCFLDLLHLDKMKEIWNKAHLKTSSMIPQP